MAITYDDLKAVQSFDDLAVLFHQTDKLNWPLDKWPAFGHVRELYEIENLDNLEALSAVQKLTDDDQWAIFLLEFGDSTFARGTLRRVLDAVATKTRPKHDNPTWLHNNILFICHSKGNVWTLCHFRGDKLANAKLKQFGWSDPLEARTAVENLNKLKWGQDWNEAWNVEKLTKDFFTKLSALFYDTVDALADKIKDENDRRLFVQTLFNRLIFLRFVEKKAWLKLGDRPDYLRALWEAGQNGVTPFWPTRLHALFRAVNNEVNHEAHKTARSIIGDVPYLNGGLFDDDPRFVDATIKIPDRVFTELVGPDGLFYKYNFTVEESSPLDVHVSVDPEILGKIFEQLTISSKRHDTGSYYTPREIVQFMCREALVGYLTGKGLPVEKARSVVYDHVKKGLDDDEGDLVWEALLGIKVVDPACGSGAYLLGMLQELYALLNLFNRRDKRTGEDPATFEHERKLWLIENNIYGVDLQAFASNTAMLRLWLTLLVEDYGADPKPLPNLEYKIEWGDALLGPDPSQQIDWAVQHKRSGKTSVQAGLDVWSREETIRELRDIRHEYQNTHGPSKSKLKSRFEVQLAALREKVSGSAKKNPALFDWRVEFFDVFLADPRERNPGFDVVLANPPYVRADAKGSDDLPDAIRKAWVSKWKAYRKQLKDSPHYETLHEKWDLYIPFLERAFKMLAPGGSMTFIIPDAYNTAKYAERSHEFFLREATVLRLDFCSDIPLFNAGVYNTILHLSRTHPTPGHQPVRMQRMGTSPDDFESMAVELPTAPQAELGTRVFRSDIATVEIGGESVPLAEVCYISKGIVLHSESQAFRAGDLIQSTSDATHPKRFFRGKDMERWLVPSHGYLEWGTSRAPSEFSRPTFPELYEVPEKLISMDLAGGRPRVIYDNQELFHNHSAWSFVPWYRLLGVRNASIQKTARYANEAARGVARMTMARETLEETSRRFPLKYILGVMNSSPGAKWMAAHRKNKMHIFPDDWREFPIPLATATDVTAIESLVQACLDSKATDPEANVSAYEADIDARVEFLYFHQHEAPTYDEWLAKRQAEEGTVIEDIRKLIAAGESGTVEFKQSLEYVDPDHPDIQKVPEPQRPAKLAETRKAVLHSALKTICAFANSKGGTLLLGVHDTQGVWGLEGDFAMLGAKKDRDGFENKLTDILKTRVRPIPTGLDIDTVEIDNKWVCRITVPAESTPHYLDNKLYVRLGNSTEELTGRDLEDWLSKRAGASRE